MKNKKATIRKKEKRYFIQASAFFIVYCEKTGFMTHIVKEKRNLMYKKISLFLLYIVFCGALCAVGIKGLLCSFEETILPEGIVTTNAYRKQEIGEEICQSLQEKENVGEFVAEYLLKREWDYKSWEKNETFEEYNQFTKAIWNDVKYFPIPEFQKSAKMTVSYVNTWLAERTYGGRRGHEGTDLIANINERGLYPVVSMTDGKITKKGWLEKGGYRIGVTAPNGAYFYYAHLESYAHFEEGDVIKAGDVLGFMGDSGYGEEGTVGQFVVHLHLGIYIYSEGKEVSVNPYWVLRYIENKRVKCFTEV